jgi:pimeloyl-ACP methyl ester carboxylesterase
MWQPQLEAVPAGWRFIAPDLRGFGQSQVGDPSAPPSMEGHARDVVALLDHLRLDLVAVGGLSMGGYVAFGLMRLAPERVAGLVLADTRAEADDEAARLGRDRMAETLDQGGLAPAVESVSTPARATSLRCGRRSCGGSGSCARVPVDASAEPPQHEGSP